MLLCRKAATLTNNFLPFTAKSFCATYSLAPRGQRSLILTPRG